MASVGLERIMDRVSLVFDCVTDAEATELYNLLASQALDGNSFRLNMGHEQVANDEVAGQGFDGNPAREPPISSPAGALTAEKADVPSDLQDEMTNIETLIGRLQETKKRFGNGCVYIRRGGLSWGAVALNYAADDKKHGVFDLQAAHDRECERHAGQVKRLMEARDRWMALAENVQAPVAGIRSALPPSSARERREIIEECAKVAEYQASLSAELDAPLCRECCQDIARNIRSLSSDGRGREKGNTSNASEGVDPSPPATGKAESQ